jgi:hypothetical protein
MEILIVGPLNGEAERLKGLVEVSEAKLIFVLGPINVKKPIKLKRTWFYVHGRENYPEILSASDGVDIMSRVFKTKEISFSGLSGYIHPQTVKFTRKEWEKMKGKFTKRYISYVFNEDIELLKITFRNLHLQRLDLFFTVENPRKREIQEIINFTSPRYLFYPSIRFSKEKQGETELIGLEPATSPKGKYILRL